MPKQLTVAPSVTLSLNPLPSRTTISCLAKSTSFTRKRTASIKRIPPPYNNEAINACVPVRRDNTDCTSLTVNTTGRRLGAFACVTLSNHGNCISNTSR